MNESQFLEASLSAAVRGRLAEQRLFDTNEQESGVDQFDRYRMPQGATRSTGDAAERNIATVGTNANHHDEASFQRVRFHQQTSQVPVPEKLYSRQLDGGQRGAEQANLANTTDKKDEGAPSVLVIGLEIAAVAFFVRCGMKHLAKNGISFFESAGGAAKNLAPKLETTAKTISPSTIAELNPLRSTAVNLEHQIPRIRTTERETGPLRVG